MPDTRPQRIYRNTKNMVRRRGYIVSSKLEPEGDTMPNFVGCHRTTGKKLCVLFVTGGIGVKELAELKSGNIHEHLIIVYGGTLSPSVKRHVSQQCIVEVFHMNDFIFDITTHHSQPDYHLCSQEEKAAVRQRYQDAKFPKIKSCDPMSKYWGAQTGDMFRIVRKSDSGGLYTLYRVVE